MLARHGESGYGSSSGPRGHSGSCVVNESLRVLVDFEVSRALFEVVQTLVTNLKDEMIKMIDERNVTIIRVSQPRVGDITCHDIVIYHPPILRGGSIRFLVCNG